LSQYVDVPVDEQVELELFAVDYFHVLVHYYEVVTVVVLPMVVVS
jgi:hypothetical protein